MSWLLFAHSLGVGIAATVLALLGGITGALLAWGIPCRYRSWAAVPAVLGLLMPPFLLANAWLGWLATWRALHSPQWVQWTGLPLTAAALAGLFWPIPAVMAYQALERIPALEMEIEPGLKGWALLRHLVWPSIWPAVRSVAPLVLVLSLANFTLPTLFQVRVFTEAFWVRFNTQMDPWAALATSWPLLIVPVLVLFAPRSPWYHRSGTVRMASFRLVRQRLGAWLLLVLLVESLWLFLVLGYPLVSLIAAPRTWSELGGAFAAGRNAWENSLVTSVLPATSAMAFSVAWVSVDRAARGPGFAWFLFLVPGVFLGLVAIQVFDRPPFIEFYQSSGVQILVLTLRYLPLAWAATAAFVDPARRDRIEAARLAGANPFQRWRVTVLPPLVRPLFRIWLVIACLCLWDVESVVLVQPPDGETLALRIFNLLHYGHADQVNALAVVLMATAFCLTALAGIGMAFLAPGNSGRSGWSLAAAIAGTVLLLGTAGCQQRSEEGQTALQSSLFQAVQILGTHGTAPGQFNKPRSLVCDRGDNLYVVDMTGRVQKFDSSGHWLLQWQMPETTLGKPKGMSLDPDGNVIVVEPHYQRVNHFTPEGRLVAQWGVKGTNVGQFILPRAIAVTSRREYVVSEYTVVDRIQRFSLEFSGTIVSGKPGGIVADQTPFHLLGFWGEPGRETGQLNRAEGLGIDAQDRVYVADSCNHRIQVFQADGTFIRTYGRAGRDPGEFSYPYDIKVDADGRQYVCEFGNSRITILDSQDHVIELLGGDHAGGQPGRFANPWSIALDSLGNLYVADSQNHRVQKFLRRGIRLHARRILHGGETGPVPLGAVPSGGRTTESLGS